MEESLAQHSGQGGIVQERYFVDSFLRGVRSALQVLVYVFEVREAYLGLEVIVGLQFDELQFVVAERVPVFSRLGRVPRTLVLLWAVHLLCIDSSQSRELCIKYY